MRRVLRKVLRHIGYHLVSDHLPSLPDPRTSPAAKSALLALYNDLNVRARTAGTLLPRLEDCGLRAFSQFEEDGYLLYLAAVLDIREKTFLDVGSADGVNSNCANLALNLGWHGLFIDADEGSVLRGRAYYEKHPDTWLYPPLFTHATVTAENVNELVAGAGLSGEIGICSIDIDGNDMWVWNALDVVSPQVVVIETHAEFGTRNIAVPYDPQYVYPGIHPEYHGASPVAMVNLADRKGYRLVGANRFGFNFFFVRNDVQPDRVKAVRLDSILRHPRYFDRLKLFEEVQHLPYVRV